MRVFRHTVALDGEFLLGSRALRFAVHFDDFGESHTLVSTSCLDHSVRLWSFERTVAATRAGDNTGVSKKPQTSNAASKMFHGVFGKLVPIDYVELESGSGILGLDFKEDMSTIAVGTEGGYVQLLDSTQMNVELGNDCRICANKRWKAHRTAVTSLAFLRNKSTGEYTMATASLDATIKIWGNDDCHLASGSQCSLATPLRILHSSIGGICKVLWAPAAARATASKSESGSESGSESTAEDQLFLVAGTLKNEILVWVIDPTTSRALRLSSFEGHTDCVNDLHFLWSKTPQTDDRVHSPSESAGSVPENLRIVSVSSDKHLHVWDTQNMKVLKNTANADAQSDVRVDESHSVPVTVCDVSTKGFFAASGDQDGYIIVWETRSGQAISRFRAEKGVQLEDQLTEAGKEPVVTPDAAVPAAVSAICISANGQNIAAGNVRGQTFVWTRQTSTKARRSSSPPKSSGGALIRAYALQSVNADAHTKPIRGIEIIPQHRDGAMSDFALATGDGSGCLKIWISESKAADGADVTNHHEYQFTSPITRLSYRKGKAVQPGSKDILQRFGNQPTNHRVRDRKLLVFLEDASITILDVDKWTRVITLRPDLNGATGISDFSIIRREFSLLDSRFQVGAGAKSNIRAFGNKNSNESNIYVHSPHEELEVAVRRARSKSLPADTLHPPPRFRSWNVPRQKPASAHGNDDGESCNQSVNNDPDGQAFVFRNEPLFTTPASYPSDNNLGDHLQAECDMARITSGGRFFVGAFEDNSLRGYDLTRDGKRCFSFVFPDTITYMAASNYPGQTSIVCGDMHGRVFILSLGIDLVVPGDPFFDLDVKMAASEQMVLDTAGRKGENEQRFEACRRDSASRSLTRLEFFSESKSQDELARMILTTPTNYVVQGRVHFNLAEDNAESIPVDATGSKAAQAPIAAGPTQAAVGVVVREAFGKKSDIEVSALDVLRSLGIRIGGTRHDGGKSEDSGTRDSTADDEFWSALHVIGSFGMEGAHAPTFARPQISNAIKTGIMPVVAELEGVIFGYGHASSLSNVLGSAFKKHGSRPKGSHGGTPFNLMGCCPLDTVTLDMESMMEQQTDTDPVVMPHRGGRPNVSYGHSSLEPNHRHFILLDNTWKEGEDTRCVIETMKMLYRRERLPVCCLLVRGEMEEKEMLLNYVIAGIPIIILEGAGGYADHLASLRANLNVKSSRMEKTKWNLVRSKMTKRREHISNLISSIRLMKDPVTNRIVQYPKLHVVALGAARDDLGPLLRRLLRNPRRGLARNKVDKK